MRKENRSFDQFLAFLGPNPSWWGSPITPPALPLTKSLSIDVLKALIVQIVCVSIDDEIHAKIFEL